jgi:hypothetical protein
MQNVPQVGRVAKLQACLKQAGAHRAVRQHGLLIFKQVFQIAHTSIIEFPGKIG